MKINHVGLRIDDLTALGNTSSSIIAGAPPLLTPTTAVLPEGISPRSGECDVAGLSEYRPRKQSAPAGRADHRAWSGAAAGAVYHRGRQGGARRRDPSAPAQRFRDARRAERGAGRARRVVSDGRYLQPAAQ